ncbi:putative orfan [Tupanvirus soda lake]|uniref:Orfan n=2 Tax=Tupanvirus TaxID=2094720 RepID=A0AC62ABW9_9VIRU|nr:putative orfan [Tupanvirus soda lake]QKU35194.1 putative orfan [Tupanvirus soda lake]
MGFFEFLGTIVKTSAVTVGVILASAAGLAYATKPDEKILKKDIESDMTSQSGNPLEYVVDKVASKVVTGTSSTNVKDYVLVKTAEVTFADGKKHTFVGAFQNWFPVK